MAKVPVTIITPNDGEFDAEIEYTASDEEIIASLVNGLGNYGANLPLYTPDGRKLHYFLQLEQGIKVQAGSRLYLKSNAIEAAQILGRKKD